MQENLTGGLSPSDEYYTRIRPIVGDALEACHVLLLGADAGAAIAELLASSGVLHWTLGGAEVATTDGALTHCFGASWAGHASTEALEKALPQHHGLEQRWRFARLAPDAALDLLPDLILAVGQQELRQQARHLAQCLSRPALLVAPAQSLHDWLEAACLVAALARALLLRGTPFARPDLENLLATDQTLQLGSDEWPWQIKRVASPGCPTHTLLWYYDGQQIPSADEATVVAKRRDGNVLVPEDVQAAQATFRTPIDAPLLQSQSALILGCGSLGSLIARELAPLLSGLTLVDPGRVSVYNPIRQLFPTSRIGQPKAVALQQELALRFSGTNQPRRFNAIVAAPGSETAGDAALDNILAQQCPSVAIVATGTAADFAIARVLRAAGVPHLVGRCYPRARYWEAMLIADAKAPCLGCLRGHLNTGPVAPPTPEELARYAPVGELTGEPATRIESGWAASCMARLALQLLVPPSLREVWFSALLDTNRTCLIGGSYAARDSEGQWAYGIKSPGRVRTYGIGEIIGSAADMICAECGRSWPVRFLVGS